MKIGPRILLVDENAQDRALAATVLSRHLPAPVARLLSGCWFALLLGTILLCGLDTTVDLRYENF